MKKIDVSKSLIFSQNIEDFKNSLDYLYLLGYFSNSDIFSEYEEGTLDAVTVSKVALSSYSFTRDGRRYSFKYFIPKSKAVFVEEEPKKKTLRQFKSIDEFFEVTGFKIGDVVQIKNLYGFTYEETSLITGFRIYTDEEYPKMYVVFSSSVGTLDELFKHFKYLKNGKWLRFGVEE